MEQKEGRSGERWVEKDKEKIRRRETNKKKIIETKKNGTDQTERSREENEDKLDQRRDRGWENAQGILGCG